jgi:hypothetical protein
MLQSSPPFGMYTPLLYFVAKGKFKVRYLIKRLTNGTHLEPNNQTTNQPNKQPNKQTDKHTNKHTLFLNFIRILLNDYKLFHIAKRERKFF